MSNSNANAIGYQYKATYRISNNLQGGVSFTVKLTIDTSSKKITGTGNIFQPVTPPLNISTQIMGDYSFLCTMDACHILIEAKGHFPSHLHVKGMPQNQKNVSIRMSLNDDWKSGAATYRFLKSGNWQEVEFQKVILVSECELPDFESLANTVKGYAKQPVM